MRWIEAASSPCVTATQWTTFGRSARVIMETLISQWIRGQTSVVLFAFAEVRLWVIKFIAGTLFQLITLFLKYIRPQGRTELINHKWARYLVDYYGDEPQAAISHPSFFFGECALTSAFCPREDTIGYSPSLHRGVILKKNLPSKLAIDQVPPLEVI